MKILTRILISTVIFLFVFYFAPLIISSSTFIREINGNTPLILSEFCFLIFSLLFITFLSKFHFNEFGFKYVALQRYWLPIVLVLFVYGVIFILKFFLKISNINHINISIIEVFIFYTFLPSLSEEVFIRGLLQSFLSPLKHWGFSVNRLHISLPVLLSIIYFIIAHIGILANKSRIIFLLPYFINITFIGFLTAYYREKTDSILPSIFIHLTANIINGFLPIVFLK